MTVRVTCDGDGCGKTIDRDAGGWFGVDYAIPPVESEPDVDGMVFVTETIQLGADHEFHFCCPDCLVSWAFSRSFSPQPEGTTT